MEAARKRTSLVSVNSATSTPQGSVLFLLPSVAVDAKSLIQCFSVCSTTFKVHIATPSGLPIAWSPEMDDNCRRWLIDRAIPVPAAAASSTPIQTSLTSNSPSVRRQSSSLTLANTASLVSLASPAVLKEMIAEGLSMFQGLVIPDGQGFQESEYNDICTALEHFMEGKKPICMIGGGAYAVLSTKPKSPDIPWIFAKCSLTGPSNMDSIKNSAAVISPDSSFEFFVTIWGGSFMSGRDEHGCHVIVDDNVVTGRNKFSTLIAIQNLILVAKRMSTSSS